MDVKEYLDRRIRILGFSNLPVPGWGDGPRTASEGPDGLVHLRDDFGIDFSNRTEFFNYTVCSILDDVKESYRACAEAAAVASEDDQLLLQRNWVELSRCGLVREDEYASRFASGLRAFRRVENRLMQEEDIRSKQSDNVLGTFQAVNRIGVSYEDYRTSLTKQHQRSFRNEMIHEDEMATRVRIRKGDEIVLLALSDDITERIRTRSKLERLAIIAVDVESNLLRDKLKQAIALIQARWKGVKIRRLHERLMNYGTAFSVRVRRAIASRRSLYLGAGSLLDEISNSDEVAVVSEDNSCDEILAKLHPLDREYVRSCDKIIETYQLSDFEVMERITVPLRVGTFRPTDEHELGQTNVLAHGHEGLESSTPNRFHSLVHRRGAFGKSRRIHMQGSSGNWY
jgi:hypothetical protein